MTDHTRHTLGPWRVKISPEDPDWGRDVLIVGKSDQDIVARVAACVDEDEILGKVGANAKILAASLDLLELLETLLNGGDVFEMSIEFTDDVDYKGDKISLVDWWEKAERLVARVKGKA